MLKARGGQEMGEFREWPMTALETAEFLTPYNTGIFAVENGSGETVGPADKSSVPVAGDEG